MLNRIQFPDIVLVRRLVHIAVQVLDAHAVKRAVKRTLEQCPKRFNTVRMSKMVNGRSDRLLLIAVIHPEVSCKPLVALVLRYPLSVFAL